MDVCNYAESKQKCIRRRFFAGQNFGWCTEKTGDKSCVLEERSVDFAGERCDSFQELLNELLLVLIREAGTLTSQRYFCRIEDNKLGISSE